MKPIFTSTLLAIALISSLHCGAYAAEGDPYVWPAYTSTLNYSFKERMKKTFPMPTKDLEDCNGVVGTQSSGWWTFKWGKNKRSVVTAAAITPMLARYNKDFAYFRDSMGWAPDSRIRDGYRSAIYLFGSGLCTDTQDSTALGGWQSAVGKYPIVLASYYPVYSFDPACRYEDREAQMGAMIHEGIHSLLADLPGARKSAWIHEAGNTWLQQQADAQRTGNFSTMGFLNAAALIAPFMPIECYSGWLQDGSFGGPAAEGVNENGADGKQICTWRNLLGGTQYGNLFPVFLGEWIGPGTVPWIWNYCPVRVLEGMADSLGDAQIRTLIIEYRARLALLDLKKWSEASKKLINDNFGSSIGSEWEPYKINVAPWIATPYAKTTDSSGYLIPEARTTPGWSGANQIPLKVTGSSISVSFRPLGPNMSLQLCYRATDGTSVYSVPVSTGKATLNLKKAPANGVVIAVVCNTDYKYLGEATRKAHYDYRLKPESGITGVADVNRKWYDVKMVSTSEPRQKPTEVRKNQIQLPDRVAANFDLRMENGSVRVDFTLAKSGPIQLSVYTASGALITHLSTGVRKAGVYQEKIDLSKIAVPEATFLVTLKSGANRETRSMTLPR